MYVDTVGLQHTRAFRIKAAAQGWLDSITAAVVAGTWVDRGKRTEEFGGVAQRWMLSKAGLKPTSQAGYRCLLDTLVLPFWGDVRLVDIDFAAVQTWVSSLRQVGGGSRFTDRGLSASRVIQAHYIVSAVLKFAVKCGLLVRNPAEEVELPRKVESEPVFLTHVQLLRLADECVQYKSLVLVLGYCGLRVGVAIALRIGDVDLDRARIRVRRSATRVPGQGYVEGTPKNHAARTVPVPRIALGPLRATIGDRTADALVWPPTAATGWLTSGALRWVFDAAVKRCAQTCAGFPRATPHQLRHTCATLAISAGANVKVLQTLLGHKTATMTLDHYGHLMPDDLEHVANAMDAAAENAAYPLHTRYKTRPVRWPENRPEIAPDLRKCGAPGQTRTDTGRVLNLRSWMFADRWPC
ncbi:site-specific integrase [Nocardia sp. 348MFTsu5.1]|uniref:tyrosine-type recombinase/integrase n=1 Tax=Nocardia sp. 348MFTsu5.1 TaxID=1172185 RepID=UPI000364BC04|nr:site-specific integrase [Nocardia sp. 348MFTsu5.1]